MVPRNNGRVVVPRVTGYAGDAGGVALGRSTGALVSELRAHAEAIVSACRRRQRVSGLVAFVDQEDPIYQDDRWCSPQYSSSPRLGGSR